MSADTRNIFVKMKLKDEMSASLRKIESSVAGLENKLKTTAAEVKAAKAGLDVLAGGTIKADKATHKLESSFAELRARLKTTAKTSTEASGGIGKLTGTTVKADPAMKKLSASTAKATTRLKNANLEAKKTSAGFATLTGNILKSAPAFAVATAAIAAAYAALRKIRDELAAGFMAVEDYQNSVVRMAAVIASFSETSSKNIAAGYKEAKRYAQDLVTQLEIMDAKTLATGEDLANMAQEFINNRVLLNVYEKEQREAFVNIANAVKVLTAGQQNASLQMVQEISAVLRGQSKPGDKLAKFLEGKDPQFKEHMKQWREEGTIIKHMGELLSGFGAAADDFSETWEAIKTTMQTINRRVLRGGFKPIFDDIVAKAREIKALFVNDDGSLTQFSVDIQHNLHDAWDSAKGIVDALSRFGESSTAKLLADIAKAYLLFKGGKVITGLAGKVAGLGSSAATALGGTATAGAAAFAGAPVTASALATLAINEVLNRYTGYGFSTTDVIDKFSKTKWATGHFDMQKLQWVDPWQGYDYGEDVARLKAAAKTSLAQQAGVGVDKTAPKIKQLDDVYYQSEKYQEDIAANVDLLADNFKANQKAIEGLSRLFMTDYGRAVDDITKKYEKWSAAAEKLYRDGEKGAAWLDDVRAKIEGLKKTDLEALSTNIVGDIDRATLSDYGRAVADITKKYKEMSDAAEQLAVDNKKFRSWAEAKKQELQGLKEDELTALAERFTHSIDRLSMSDVARSVDDITEKYGELTRQVEEFAAVEGKSATWVKAQQDRLEALKAADLSALFDNMAEGLDRLSMSDYDKAVADITEKYEAWAQAAEELTAAGGRTAAWLKAVKQELRELKESEISDIFKLDIEGLERLSMSDYGRAVYDVTQKYDGLIKKAEQLNRDGKVTVQWLDNIKARFEKLKEIELGEVADKANSMARDVKDAFAGWASDFSSKLTDLVWDAKTSFSDIARSFGMMLTQMVIQKKIMEPILSDITGSNIFGSLVSGFTGTAAPDVALDTGGWLNEPIFGVGASGKTYALAENGPEFIANPRRGQVAAGGGIVVNIHNNNGSQVKTKSSRTADGRQSLEIMIDQAVAKRIDSGRSNAADSLARMFGSQPALVGR